MRSFKAVAATTGYKFDLFPDLEGLSRHLRSLLMPITLRTRMVAT
jgi:hypothetical protein